MLDALGDAVDRAPYKGRPLAVVLQVKPPSTLVAPGGALRVDDAVPELVIDATLGVVIGRRAFRVREGDALGHVAGMLLAIDAHAPLADLHRPSARLRARDASCALGAIAALADPDAVALRTLVDGRVAATSSTADAIRRTARLITEVSDFMTLSPGDVLLTGSAAAAPRAGAGCSVRVEADGLAALEVGVERDPADRGGGR